MDSTEEPEVSVASEKSISDEDIFEEFDEFEAQMKYKYGTKASAITMNLFAQGGGKRGERVEFERDYELIGTSLNTVAHSSFLVYYWLQFSNVPYDFKSSVIHMSSVFVLFLVQCCTVINSYHSRSGKSSEKYRKPIVDYSKPIVDITTDFDTFQAKMKDKYGEKATSATMKFFAQGAQARGELNVKERFYFKRAMTLTQSALAAFSLYLSLSKQGSDYPLLAYFSICCHSVALYVHGSNITHDRYSKLFTPSSYSIVIFIVSIAFAAHFSTFYSWTHVYHSQ